VSAGDSVDGTQPYTVPFAIVVRPSSSFDYSFCSLAVGRVQCTLRAFFTRDHKRNYSLLSHEHRLEDEAIYDDELGISSDLMYSVTLQAQITKTRILLFHYFSRRIREFLPTSKYHDL